MARRPIWKGVVGFGMVAIPIKLYTATENKDVAFSMLHKTCGTRLRQKRWCPEHEVEVPQDEIARGYEYAKDQYVVMEDADFEELPVASLHTIEITQFVGLDEIDPMNYERSFILEPEGVGVKPFYLLKQSLESSRRAGIGKVSLRNKEHICCLRPYGHAIALHTMFYQDEIRGETDLALPEEKTAITGPEMAMATALIDQLAGTYDPAAYADEYRGILERVIEAKLGSAPMVTTAPAPAHGGKVTDLMEALRASIAAAKAAPRPAAKSAPARVPEPAAKAAARASRAVEPVPAARAKRAPAKTAKG